MAVQVGEGTVEIIFGSASIPAGPVVLGGYLARPDAEGQWPTVLVFGPEPVPVSSVKHVCRVLARHGIAALAPDLTESHDANLERLRRVARFVKDPTGLWSNAELGFGVLAFGSGAPDASGLAMAESGVAALAMVGGTIGGRVRDDVVSLQLPGLWIGSRGDGDTDIDVTLDAREQLPLTTFVVHSDAETGFWDDGADGYDEGIAADSMERVVTFFLASLPAITP